VDEDGVFNRGLETQHVGEKGAESRKKVQIFRDTGYRLGKLRIWEMWDLGSIQISIASPSRLVFSTIN
jgi:hypothetical protein